MPPPTQAQIDLILRFEPILFFHPAERFFPSDAKRYVEHCALYKSNAPFQTLSDWGPSPAINSGMISLVPVGPPGTTYLGRKINNAYEFLEFPDPPPPAPPTPTVECFLDLAGWKAATSELPYENQYADLDAVAARYSDKPELADSRFWYHAEFFDFTRLKRLFRNVVATGGHDFHWLLQDMSGRPSDFKSPALICYYLFFPGHDEGLAPCENVAVAKEFASFAGEWACVAVLLDKLPTEEDAKYAPKLVGLTNRNIGAGVHDGKEIRVGMRILDWRDDQAFERHPRLAVAKGTHGIYLASETPAAVQPLTPPDGSRDSCGLAKPFPPLIPAFVDEFPGLWTALHWKVLAGASLGSMFSPALTGVVAASGLAAWIHELAASSTPVSTPEPPSTAPATIDAVATAGKVVHPKDKRPADVPAGPDAIAWRSRDTVAPNPNPFFVDRDAQLFWPHDPAYDGYTGRWGPRVESDSYLNRAGMRFPDFWRVFFDARVLNDPPPYPARVMIDAGEGVPIGNAMSGGGLIAAYDGNTAQTFAASPTSAASNGVYIGKRFATPYRINGMRIWLSSDFGLNNKTGLARTLSVRGKNGSDPTSPMDGTEIYASTSGLTDTASGIFMFMDGFNTATAYDRVWVTVQNPAGNKLAVFTEIEWYRVP